MTISLVTCASCTYHCYLMSVSLTARAVPSSLADILASLELRQPKVVTRALIQQFIEETGSRIPAEAVVERLVRAGWLLPLRSRDAWEFAPAAHAGRFGSGDPWIELRALLEHRPEAPVAVAYESAAWEHGYTTHQPETPVLAHRPLWRAPRSISARTVSYDWHLPTQASRGLPVWQPATLVVAAADHPAAQGDWGNADDWLPETFRAVAQSDVLTEAGGRGNATLARLGHLAEWSGRADIADIIETMIPKPLNVTFLGPRRPKGRWIRRWHLYDAILPQR
jgi:hypothetical protein